MKVRCYYTVHHDVAPPCGRGSRGWFQRVWRLAARPLGLHVRVPMGPAGSRVGTSSVVEMAPPRRRWGWRHPAGQYENALKTCRVASARNRAPRARVDPTGHIRALACDFSVVFSSLVDGLAIWFSSVQPTWSSVRRFSCRHPPPPPPHDTITAAGARTTRSAGRTRLVSRRWGAPPHFINHRGVGGAGADPR